MVYRIMLLEQRKPGTSLEEFCKFEELHVAEMRQRAGKAFPLNHSRRILQRADSPATTKPEDRPGIPTIMGETEFDYDMIVEHVYRDEAHFQEFVAVMLNQPENKEWLDSSAAHWVTGKVKYLTAAHYGITFANGQTTVETPETKVESA